MVAVRCRLLIDVFVNIIPGVWIIQAPGAAHAINFRAQTARYAMLIQPIKLKTARTKPTHSEIRADTREAIPLRKIGGHFLFIGCAGEPTREIPEVPAQSVDANVEAIDGDFTKAESLEVLEDIERRAGLRNGGAQAVNGRGVHLREPELWVLPRRGQRDFLAFAGGDGYLHRGDALLHLLGAFEDRLGADRNIGIFGRRVDDGGDHRQVLFYHAGADGDILGVDAAGHHEVHPIGDTADRAVRIAFGRRKEGSDNFGILFHKAERYVAGMVEIPGVDAVPQIFDADADFVHLPGFHRGGDIDIPRHAHAFVVADILPIHHNGSNPVGAEEMQVKTAPGVFRRHFHLGAIPDAVRVTDFGGQRLPLIGGDVGAAPMLLQRRRKLFLRSKGVFAHGHVVVAADLPGAGKRHFRARARVFH